MISLEKLDVAESDINDAEDFSEVSYESAKQLKKYKNMIPFSFNALFRGKKKASDKATEKELERLEKESAKNQPLESLKKGHLKAKSTSALPLQSTKISNTGNEDIEDEIENNLNEIRDVTKSLREMALDMNTELEKQGKIIQKVSIISSHTTDNLKRADEKIKKYGRK